MREIVLGTAGHVDHGKTSLIKALTGIDTDRLKEEKERGITIELGFAHLDLACGHRLGIIDVPGHERFVRNMVAGAAGMDLVAFIIAADEGVMPQTREHFEICQLLGIEQGLIIITKKDMVEPEWLELVEEEVREYFSDTFLADAPLIAVSSTTGEGIDAVRTLLDEMVRDKEFHQAHGPFRMPIDRVFTIRGFGAVVTGTSISGRIRISEEVSIFPKKIIAKIRGIQVHASEVQEVEAGHRTALNLHGVDRELLERGDVIATPGCLQPTFLLDADFIYLESARKNLKNRTRVRIHLGTAEILGRLVLLEDEELVPGCTANVQIRLEKPATAWPGDRYVVRSYSPVTTIGGGGILNGSPRKRRRFRRETTEIFNLYHQGTPEELALFFLKESGYHGLDYSRLGVKTGIFGNRLKKLLSGPLSARKVLVVDSDKHRLVEAGVYAKLAAKAKEILAAYHRDNPLKAGLSREELRSRLYHGLDQRLFQFMLKELIRKKEIEQDQALIRLSGHVVALQEDDHSLRRDILALYRDGGLGPPTIKDLQARFTDTRPERLKQILDLLVQDQELVRVTENLYFPRAALVDLENKLVAHLKEHREIDAAGFKEITNTTRKFSIPLMEYFDKIKLTLRVGDKRVLR